MGVQRGLFTVVVVTAATVAMNPLAQSTFPGRGQSPPPLMLDSIAGRDSFEFYCASCHGTGGKGDGPIASALKVPPTDLTVAGPTEPRCLSERSGTGRGHWYRPTAARTWLP